MDAHAETGDDEKDQVLIPEIMVTPEEMEQISDPEVMQTKPLQLEDLLEDHDAFSLPKHRRCISHTLNILATRDVSNVPRCPSDAKDPFNKTLAKAQELWNAQNRKITTAARIKKEL